MKKIFLIALLLLAQNASAHVLNIVNNSKEPQYVAIYEYRAPSHQQIKSKKISSWWKDNNKIHSIKPKGEITLEYQGNPYGVFHLATSPDKKDLTAEVGLLPIGKHQRLSSDDEQITIPE